jgi:Amt family ammonium transporter
MVFAVCGGAIAAGIFGSTALGGLGGVSLISQIIGTTIGISIAFVGGYIVYVIVNKVSGIRMSDEEQYQGADLTYHKIHANPLREDY